MVKLFANNTIGQAYEEQLRKEHEGSNWGSTGARYSGADIARLLNRYNPVTGLDYGCGKGTVAQHFTSVDWAEYDPGIEAKSQKPSGRFDIVVCTDVMEHVEEEHVPGVVAELGKHTKTVLFVDIACYLTGKTFASGPYAGKDLHITVWDPEDWIRMFNMESGLKMLESRIIDKVSKGGLKRRLQLVYERV